MYYPNVTEYLNDHLAGFKNENKSNKSAIIKMIFCTTRHFRDADAVALPVKFIRELGFSSNNFNRLNKKYNLYEIDPYFKEGSHSRRLYPTDNLNAILLGYAHNKYRSPCVVRKEVRKGVFRDSQRFEISPRLLINGVNIQGVIDINRKGLLEAVGNGMENKTHLFQALRLLALSDVEGLQLGEMPQAFRVSGSVERIHGVGTTIQNTPRPLRKIVMSGYNDYDFVNCHYVIAAHHLSGGALTEYANNPKSIRESIARELNTDIDKVKIALLALLNGAKEQYNEYFNAIPQILGNKARDFFNIPIVRALKEEADELAYQKIGDRPRKQMAIYLMNEEANILRVAVEDKLIAVPMHDGFMTKEEVSIDDMQKDIKMALGYNITIIKKQEKDNK